jgi:hypothetical protein
MFTRASEEERDSFCRALYYFFVPSFVERENSFSFLSSVFSFPTPAPTTKDERESKSKKEEKRRSIRPKKKIFPKGVAPGRKKIRLLLERNQKNYKRARKFFRHKTTHAFFSLRNYVCTAKLYFHRRESCLGEIRQDDQKVSIILSRYRWIFGKHARAKFFWFLSRFVLYFLPQMMRGGTPLRSLSLSFSRLFAKERERTRKRHDSGRRTSLLVFLCRDD